MSVTASRPLTLFVDDGGVMNDNAVRGPQWQRLAGEFFAPLLGGDPADWGEANRRVATALFEEHELVMGDLIDGGYRAWLRSYHLRWLRNMCAHVGVLPPEADAECLDLARRATSYVTERVRSALPGAIDALRALRADGYTLHTGSGEEEADLHGYLTGMGVRHCFGRLYGPDVVDTPKGGYQYYARIFADAGVRPEDAVVIDDSPRAAAWAAQTGARTVLVDRDGTAAGAGNLLVRGLNELPDILMRL